MTRQSRSAVLASPTISPHTALVYVMVIAALADEALKETEFRNIASLVSNLPVFAGYDIDHANVAAGDCAAMLDQEDGIETVLGLVDEALPEELRETAYALACDVVAADGEAEQSELVWLEMLRHRLGVSRLHAAAIERGSRARYMRLSGG